MLGTIVRVANRRRIGPKLRLAAVETGLVESNLRNLAYGDGSSVGWRQETSSSYPNVNRRDVAASVNRFFNEALPLRGKYATAGALAQAVQRSAHPERYQAVRGQARELLRGLGGVSGGSAGGGRAVASSTTTRDAGPQGSALALLQALTQQPQQPQSAGLQAPAFSASPALPKGYQPVVGGGGGAQPPDMAALLAAIQTSGDTGSSRTTTDVAASGGGGAAAGAGGNFAKTHSPLRELFWQGAGGIDAKNGQKVPQGFVEGHTDHVHVAAGPKTVVELGRIAQQRFGLHVGENPHFGGVHPVHVKGSYHYKGEAIDVSGTPQKMRAFAHYVAGLYGIH